MKTLKELLANIGDFRINDADIAQLVKWGVVNSEIANAR